LREKNYIFLTHNLLAETDLTYESSAKQDQASTSMPSDFSLHCMFFSQYIFQKMDSFVHHAFRL
jgi:hypothetical protein